MGKLQDIFPDKLMELCQTKKSISKVAADLSINRQQFARYLNRTSIPREETIERIAKYFDVSPTFFFSEDSALKNTDQQGEDRPLEILFSKLRKAGFDAVKPNDLAPGLYILLKRSFIEGGRLMKSIIQVKYIDGVAHSRSIIYSSKGRGYKGQGEDQPDTFSCSGDTGVFLKADGKIIMVNSGATYGHIAVNVFLNGHTHDHNIKPGVHITLASSIAAGVRGATVMLRKIHPDESILNHARTIGWIERDQISDIELDTLSGGTFDYPGIIGV